MGRGGADKVTVNGWCCSAQGSRSCRRLDGGERTLHSHVVRVPPVRILVRIRGQNATPSREIMNTLMKNGENYKHV